jgi:AcrR family transcriptional regulator
MADKRTEKRSALRLRIVELGEARIAASGLSALRARDLAAEAGCALGGLYNMFEDLDMLVLEVNACTLATIDTVMEAAVSSSSEAPQQLKALAQAYLNFAQNHPLLWRALFEHHLPEGRALPEWYAERLNQLMSRIAQPLAKLQPGLSSEVLATRARTMFAAVHGVVSISLDHRFVGLAPETLDVELNRFVELLLKGSATGE